MGTTTPQQKMLMARLLKEAILQLCHRERLYDGQLEIDGIICISGQSEGQELVVKLHEKLGLDFSNTGLDSNDNIDPAYKMPLGADAELSQGYTSDDEPNRSHSSEPDTALDMSASHNNSSGLMMDVDDNDRSEHNSTIASVDSPPDGDSSHMGPRGLYLGKLPYLSSPAMLQKKLPLRSDRWTPGTPLPSTPECKHCGYTFASFDVLSEHNEAVHSVFTCQYCYKTFTSRSNLERHSRLHTGHRPYICSLCGKAFSRKDHLTNHATKHAFKCGTCLKRFPDKKQLSSHYTSDHRVPLCQVCEFCNKGFGTNATYEEHVKTHPQYHATRKGRSATSAGSLASTRRHLCRLCQFSCNDRITLIKHKMMHSDSHRCFTCLSCAKMFSNPLQYSNHLYTHGSEVNIFECCLCRQIYPTLEALKKHELGHVSDNHFDVDMNSNYHSCPECSKVFQSETNLQEHMEIHDSVNKFRCAVCNQGFPTYTDLWKHTEDLKHYAVAQPAEQTADLDNNNYNYDHADEQGEEQEEGEEDGDSQKAEGDRLNDSDVEIVEPQAPDDGDDPQSETGTAYDEPPFVITENPTPVIEVMQEDSAEIHMRPVKSLLAQRSSRKQGRPQRLREILPKPPEIVSRLILDVPQVAAPLNLRTNTSTSSSMLMPSKSSAANHVLEQPPYIEIKPDEPAVTERSESPAPSVSAGTSPIKAAVANIEIPPGPASCPICSKGFDTFQDMETHCLNEHSRSPCMFCSKTFAQKANRDRHLCLHTGDKPYTCPECDEKFSRGDKLKIHRTKVHNFTYPPNSRGGRHDAKDWSLSSSPSPSTNQDRSSLSPAPHSGTEEKSEDWPTHNASLHETVPATGEWTIERVEKTEPVH